jgi:hypothetical protein
MLVGRIETSNGESTKSVDLDMPFGKHEGLLDLQ